MNRTFGSLITLALIVGCKAPGGPDNDQGAGGNSGTGGSATTSAASVGTGMGGATVGGMGGLGGAGGLEGSASAGGMGGAGGVGGIGASGGVGGAGGAPVSCDAPPDQWPAASKPYFMLAIDTSGSMTAPAMTANLCGYTPNDRNAHSRCAMYDLVNSFAGEANFGLATFAVTQNSCGASCYATCEYMCFTEEINTTGQCLGCGPRPGNAATRAGAFIRSPVLQDSYSLDPPPPSNVADLLAWADNDCTGNAELFALGATPLNGMLRDLKKYFEAGWTAPDGSVSYSSPLTASDLPGPGVNGGTACRSVNVVLQTDGDEACDTQADAVAAAQDLYQNGVTVGGKTFKIRTFVVNFQGGSVASSDAIAAAGGTGASHFASDQSQLSAAFASILADSVPAEICDGLDNNCNGCVDEGCPP